MRALIFIIKFFLIAALFIAGNQNLALSVPENRDIFFQEYKIWLTTIVHNSVSLVGNAVKLEWLPESAVNFTSGN